MLVAMAVHDTEENGRTWMTEQTLHSLSKTVDWERHRLFVVDNGSCEATQGLYGRMAHELPYTLFCNEENLGTAKAINRAWHEREPWEHCVKMDNDVVFHSPHWADWMEDVFDRDPEIGICGLKRNDLGESPWGEDDMLSAIRMLPHERGQRWITVEEVKTCIGTCIAFSSTLLAHIGFLTQPGSLYGYDDCLASVRSRVAGFKNVFLCGFEIDHLDPGGDDYCKWKQAQASSFAGAFNTQALLLQSGAMGVYDDGGLDV